jgi:hypothetical protein
MFELRAVPIRPGGEHRYDEAEWRDALVFVERGEVELECLSGHTCRLSRGAVLWLVDLPLRALRNYGPESALLVAVTRAREDR